jgi:hypothetical protein
VTGRISSRYLASARSSQSQRSRVELYDLTSISTTVRSVLNSVPHQLRYQFNGKLCKVTFRYVGWTHAGSMQVGTKKQRQAEQRNVPVHFVRPVTAVRLGWPMSTSRSPALYG